MKLLKQILLFLPVEMMGGFSYYVVDIEERTLVVLDPTETSIHNDEMSVKHKVNANLVLRALRRCLSNHFADCEGCWIYLGHYWRVYNGLYLERQLGEFKLAYLKQQLVYEVITMRGSRGELPIFMIEEVLF
ncbi:uncharacterized protein [Triticum aestivum]|uniref:uncharacterized protein isoform X2 n=1 Tax=Triticum aestivum TaxID=4565 RepID=UPI001D00D4AA|nr:uncharacterized protein LOC123067003 isoform X2 [Triticum aestivum]